MEDPTGTLANVHLGISADGTSCMMVFVDENQRTTTCAASFVDFNRFVASLCEAAGEMTRRRAATLDEEPLQQATINVASAAFKLCADDGYMLGALVGDAGEVVGIRMCPDVANQMTRAMLLTAPVASTC